MPSWKKVITSGSNAALNHITSSGNISGSAPSTGSFGQLDLLSNGHLRINQGGRGDEGSGLNNPSGITLFQQTTFTGDLTTTANLFSRIFDDNKLVLANHFNNAGGGIALRTMAGGSQTTAVSIAGNTGITTINKGIVVKDSATINTDLIVTGSVSGSSTSTGSFGRTITKTMSVDDVFFDGGDNPSSVNLKARFFYKEGQYATIFGDIYHAASLGGLTFEDNYNSSTSGFNFILQNGTSALRIKGNGDGDITIGGDISGSSTSTGSFGDGRFASKVGIGLGIATALSTPHSYLDVRGNNVTPSNGNGSYHTMQLIDTTAMAEGVGGGIGFGGKFVGNTDTIFGEIRGLKENGTSNNYAGALTFQTRVHGGNLIEQVRIDSVGNLEAVRGNISGSSTSTGSFGHVQIGPKVDDGNDKILQIGNKTTIKDVRIGATGHATQFVDSSNSATMTIRFGKVGIGTDLTNLSSKFVVAGDDEEILLRTTNLNRSSFIRFEEATDHQGGFIENRGNGNTVRLGWAHGSYNGGNDVEIITYPYGVAERQLNISASVDISSHITGSGNLLITGNISGSSTSTGSFGKLSVGDGSITTSGNMILDADGAQIRLQDGGTEFGRISRVSSDLVLKSMSNNNDILFKGVDGGSTITALQLDMSEGGNAIFSGNATIPGTLAVDTNTLYVDSSANKVGINRIDPQFDLDVIGDIRATGDVIARRYVISSSVSHITSSFSSGSTIFGDTITDTHQFTGSLSVTGSGLRLGRSLLSNVYQGNLVIGSNAPAIFLDDGDVSNLRHSIVGGGNAGLEIAADINNATTGYINFGVGGNTVARMIEGGNVGIGTTIPDGRFHVHTATAGSVTAHADADDLVVENSGNGGISILTPASNFGGLFFGSPDDNIGSSITFQDSSATLFIQSRLSGGTIKLRSGDGVEAVTIDSSQNSIFAGNVSGSAVSSASFGRIDVAGKLFVGGSEVGAGGGGGGSADNLGNHTATQDLNLNSNSIKNIIHITGSGNISGSSTSTGSFGLAQSEFVKHRVLKGWYNDNTIYDLPSGGSAGIRIAPPTPASGNSSLPIQFTNNAVQIQRSHNTLRLEAFQGSVAIYDTLNTETIATFGRSGLTFSLGSISGITHVSASGNISGSSTSTGSFGNVFVRDEIEITDSNTAICEGNNNSVRLKTNNGYIEIGPQNSTLAHIYTDRNQGFFFNRAIGVHNNKIYVGDFGSEIITIDPDVSGGSPKISGSAASTGSFGELQVRGAGQEKISLFGNTQQFINFGDAADSNTGMIQYDHNNNQFQFYANATNILRVLGSGFVLPASNEGVSLGSTSLKWKELVVNHVSASGNISGSSTSTGSFGELNIKQQRIYEKSDDLIIEGIDGDGTGNITFRTGHGSGVRDVAHVDYAGAVVIGVGATIPADNHSGGNGSLTVYNNGTSIIKIANSTTGQDANSGTDLQLTSGTSEFLILNRDATDIKLKSNSNEFRLDASANAWSGSSTSTGSFGRVFAASRVDSDKLSLGTVFGSDHLGIQPAADGTNVIQVNDHDGNALFRLRDSSAAALMNLYDGGSTTITLDADLNGGSIVLEGNVSGSATSTGSFGEMLVRGFLNVGGMATSQNFGTDGNHAIRVQTPSNEITAIAFTQAGTMMGYVAYEDRAQNKGLTIACATNSNHNGIRFSTGGSGYSERMRIDNVGHITFPVGNQKISGSSTSTGSFGTVMSAHDIVLPNQKFIRFGGHGTSTRIYGDSSNNLLTMVTNGVERLRLGDTEAVFNEGGTDYDFRIEGNTSSNLFTVDAGNERVGVGMTPTTKFTVKSAADGNDQISLVHSGNTVKLASLGQLDSHGNLTLRQNNGQEKIRLHSSGSSYINTGFNFGIGKTNPSDKLEIADGAVNGATYMNLNNNHADQFLSLGINGNVGEIGVDNGDSLSFGTYTNKSTKTLTTIMTITNDGQISGSSTSTGSFGTLNLGSTSPNIDFFAPANDPAAIRFTEGGTSLTELTYDGSNLRLKSNYANRDIYLDTPNGDLMIDSTNGNVGIGTATPGHKLHVVGDIRATGDIVANRLVVSSSVSHITASFSSGSTIFGDTSDDTHQFTGSLNVNGNIQSTSGDNLSIGTSWSPAGTYGVGRFHGAHDGGGTRVMFSNANSSVRYGIVMHGSDTGTADKLGIGLLLNENATYANASPAMTIDSSKNIGMGTQSPSNKLHVYANVSSAYTALIENDQATSGHGLKVHSDGNGTGTILFDVDAAGSSRFRVRGDGSVLVGFTTSQAEKLAVNGDFRATGNISGSATSTGSFGALSVPGQATIGSVVEASSIMYKENVKQIESPLEKITKLRGVEFDYKKTNEHSIGMIAEEVNEIFPELVAKNEDGDVTAMSYTRMTAVLLEAVKELSAEVKELRKLNNYSKSGDKKK